MSTLAEDGITTDRLLELARKRIKEWEAAEPHTRTEHEAAEAFTRAFAELDDALSHQYKLPEAWAQGRTPDAGDVALILDRVRHQMTLTPDERAAVRRLQEAVGGTP